MFGPISDVVHRLGLIPAGSRANANLRSTKRHVILEVLAGNQPVCVVKFPRAVGQTFLENEAELLSELEHSITPGSTVVPPRLLHKGEIFGRLFLVESFIAGSPPPAIRSEPRMARAVIDWTVSVSRGQRHKTVQGTIDDMAARVLPSYPEIGRWLETITPDVRALPANVMHGDLSYNNLLYDGKCVGVVDWEYARLEGFPMMDAADFLLYDLYRNSRDYLVATNLLFSESSEPHASLLRAYCGQLGFSAAVVGSLVVLYVLAKLDLLVRLEAARAGTKARELMAFLVRANLQDVGARFAAR